MVFFTNRCKNKNCPLLKKTLQLSTVKIHWTACIRGRFFVCFFSIWFFQMNFHHFFLIRGPGFPEKSLGTNHRRADFFYLQLNPKPECSPVHSSVVTVRQCLVLRWEERGGLPLPDAVLLMRSCLGDGWRGTCDRSWWCAAEHPYGQRVVRELSRTWQRKMRFQCC